MMVLSLKTQSHVIAHVMDGVEINLFARVSEIFISLNEDSGSYSTCGHLVTYSQCQLQFHVFWAFPHLTEEH